MMWTRRRFLRKTPLAGLAAAAVVAGSGGLVPVALRMDGSLRTALRYGVTPLPQYPCPESHAARLLGRSWPTAGAALRAARRHRFPCIVFAYTNLEKNKADPVS